MKNTCNPSDATELNLTDLHFEQRLWINKIKFYKEQINILQSNLDRMVKFYYDAEAMAEVEQYQNKFIVYGDVADNLIKSYKAIRNKIAENEDQNETLLAEINEMKSGVCKKTKEFLSFIDELIDNFLIFYTSYYVSENHIYSN